MPGLALSLKPLCLNGFKLNGGLVGDFPTKPLKVIGLGYSPRPLLQAHQNLHLALAGWPACRRFARLRRIGRQGRLNRLFWIPILHICYPLLFPLLGYPNAGIGIKFKTTLFEWF